LQIAITKDGNIKKMSKRVNIVIMIGKLYYSYKYISTKEINTICKEKNKIRNSYSHYY